MVHLYHLHDQVWMPSNIHLTLSGAREPGGSGGSDPPRIRDLYSKNFENLQKKFFLSIGPPLGKNRSLAPAYAKLH